MITFMMYLFKQRGNDNRIGEVAREAFKMPEWDGKASTLELLIKQSKNERLLGCFLLARDAYKLLSLQLRMNTVS